jgi:NAD-dependent SIR2 family protein deacetylase
MQIAQGEPFNIVLFNGAGASAVDGIPDGIFPIHGRMLWS